MIRYRIFTFLTVLSVSTLLGSPNYSGAEENTWKAPPKAAQRINPVEADSTSIKQGRKLFVQFCATCHGEEGMGDGPVAIRLITEPPDLTTLEGKQSDGELAWKIATGKNPMPSWKDKLSEKQIWDIVNFIQNLRPAAD